MDYTMIKVLCDEIELTISELAEKSGISVATIYRSIQEKSMKVETLEKIASVLGVPIWVFFNVDPEGPFINEIENQRIQLTYCTKYNEILKNNIKDLRLENKSRQFILDQLIIQGSLLIDGKISIDTFKILLETAKRNIDLGLDTSETEFLKMIEESVKTEISKQNDDEKSLKLGMTSTKLPPGGAPTWLNEIDE